MDAGGYNEQGSHQLPNILNNAPIWAPSMARPLSDIRELTEPSLIDAITHRHGTLTQQKHTMPQRQNSRASSCKRKLSVKRNGSVRIAEPASIRSKHKRGRDLPETSSSYSTTATSDHESPFSIPRTSVPRRSSSNGRTRQPARRHARRHSSHHEQGPSSIQNSPAQDRYNRVNNIVPNRGPGRSPVKITGLRLGSITSDAVRKIPSKTLIRSPYPADILEFPTYRHARIKLDLHVSAPLFVGGGSIEGFVKVIVDSNDKLRQRRSLGIGGLSVDVLGFEEMNAYRKAAFLSLGTELIDGNHQPPSTMVESLNPVARSQDGTFWSLKPSSTVLPFMISLPLDTGPPPFQAKYASIRFLLAVTAVIKDSGKQYRIRSSKDVHVLSTYDPEKALTSLPSPLMAKDELHLTRHGAVETLKLIAGLHRQVWVSGGSIFADIHLANKTHKTVKKLELTLERDILCYKHAAASTLEKSAGQARIFESNDQAILAKVTSKQGHDGWPGLGPFTSETRTCVLELPRGHATVKCGKFFEVRFFLNVTASLSSTGSKLVSVQLPVILIHLNSLDVLPNAVAQVAAAIEEKKAESRRNHRSSLRSQSKATSRHEVSRKSSFYSPTKDKENRKNSSFKQGQVFAAPRKQSLERARQEREVIDDLCKQLDSSPRKYQAQLDNAFFGALRPASQASSLRAGSTPPSKNNVASSPKSPSGLPSLSYKTPPSNRKARNFDGADENTSGLRRQLRRFRSADTLQRKQSSSTSNANTGEKPSLAPLRRMYSSHSHGTGNPLPFRSKSSVDRHRYNLKPDGVVAQQVPVLASNSVTVQQQQQRANGPETRPSTGWSVRRGRHELAQARKTDTKPAWKVSQGLREKGRELFGMVSLRKQNSRDGNAVDERRPTEGLELVGVGRGWDVERTGWI